MKTGKTHRNRMTATALVALLAIATPAFAWMGSWGYGMGYGGGQATAGAALNAEQQKQVDEVQSKYQPQLNELQQKLNAKASELAAARANGDTTVSQLNALETELFQLERQYWTLLDRANAEAARVAGTGFGSYFTCGYMGCNHQHYRGSVMPSGYMTCCW